MSPIESMTGLGRGEATSPTLSAVVEVKSVNHRFLDVRSKLPTSLFSFESSLKKQIGESFKRGSFDVFVQVRRTDGEMGLVLDEKKIAGFLKRMGDLARQAGVQVSVSPGDLLRNEFQMEATESSSDATEKLAREALAKALNGLRAGRREEGAKLVSALRSQMGLYRQSFKVIEDNQEKYRDSVEEKLRRRFQEMKDRVSVDEPRFLQELVYYLEKVDVQEEIVRVHSHLEKLDRLLATGGEVGRQLDFLLQELGRETNTIGSKSSLKEISDAVVQMKVQLEKTREQALNLE